MFFHLPKYDRTTFFQDANAGLITAIMLIPQAMAYALLAGIPPVLALHACIWPLVIYAFPEDASDERTLGWCGFFSLNHRCHDQNICLSREPLAH